MIFEQRIDRDAFVNVAAVRVQIENNPLDLAGRLKSCREAGGVDSIPAADVTVKRDVGNAVVSLHRWGLRHSR